MNKMKKNIKIEWGGSKNTIIPKMLNPRDVAVRLKKRAADFREPGIPEKIIMRPEKDISVKKIDSSGNVTEVVPITAPGVEGDFVDPGIELFFNDSEIYKVGVPVEFNVETIDPEWAETLWGVSAEVPLVRDTLTVDSPGEISDVVPNPLGFPSKNYTSSNLQKEAISDAAMITGINRPVKISIQGNGVGHNYKPSDHDINPRAQYKINAGRWQSGEDEVENGDMVTLKALAPEVVRSQKYFKSWWAQVRGKRSYRTIGGGEQTIILKVGGATSTWTVTSS